MQESSNIYIYPLTQMGTVESWGNALLENAADIKMIPAQNREIAHYKWWQQFWNRSYIYVTSKDADGNKQAENLRRDIFYSSSLMPAVAEATHLLNSMDQILRLTPITEIMIWKDWMLIIVDGEVPTDGKIPD